MFRDNHALDNGDLGLGHAFLSALFSRINNLCSCHIDTGSTKSEDVHHDISKCDKCTIARDSGFLQIAKVSDFNHVNVKHSETSSLVLHWTSNTDTLLAPKVETLELTEQISRLGIRVDIIPALKILDDIEQTFPKRFVIQKECFKYWSHDKFMVSYCLYELSNT